MLAYHDKYSISFALKGTGGLYIHCLSYNDIQIRFCSPRLYREINTKITKSTSYGGQQIKEVGILKVYFRMMLNVKTNKIYNIMETVVVRNLAEHYRDCTTKDQILVQSHHKNV